MVLHRPIECTALIRTKRGQFCGRSGGGQFVSNTSKSTDSLRPSTDKPGTPQRLNSRSRHCPPQRVAQASPCTRSLNSDSGTTNSAVQQSKQTYTSGASTTGEVSMFCSPGGRRLMSPMNLRWLADPQNLHVKCSFMTTSFSGPRFTPPLPAMFHLKRKRTR
jgi:hypothetical protein